MKRIFTLLFTISVSAVTLNAQPLLAEDFNFTGNLSDNGWTPHSGIGTTPINTTNGLTYSGYAGSGIGNAANMTGTGEDVYKPFTKQSADGTVLFLTAMVNVTDPNAFTGMYFMHLGATTATSFSNFTARIYVKPNATTGVNFGVGISTGDAAGVYGTSTFSKNTTYLIIAKYMIKATGNDSIALWVRDAGGTAATEAELGMPEATTGGSQPVADGVDGVGLRQNTQLPDMVVDGIRVTTSYSDVLPLNLVSFKASLIENTVVLNWLSSNETNTKEISVERSKDGRDFSSVGSISALNTSNAKYTYTDRQPLEGFNFYRLKIVDKDGSVKYSKVLSINRSAGIKATIFPNPAINNVTLRHSKATFAASIKVVSAVGQMITEYAVPAGAIQTSIAVNKLIRGNYMVIYQNNGERSVTQFTKQ